MRWMFDSIIKELAGIREALVEIAREVCQVTREPAAQIALHVEGKKMATNPFTLVAGGGATVVTLLPLPSGSSFASPPNASITADDPNVVIEPNPGDTTGLVFAVSTPASDTATETNLTATAMSSSGSEVSGSQEFAIQPAAPVVTPATSVGFSAVPPSSSSASASVAASAASASVKTAAAATKTK